MAIQENPNFYNTSIQNGSLSVDLNVTHFTTKQLKQIIRSYMFSPDNVEVLLQYSERDEVYTREMFETNKHPEKRTAFIDSLAREMQAAEVVIIRQDAEKMHELEYGDRNVTCTAIRKAEMRKKINKIEHIDLLDKPMQQPNTITGFINSLPIDDFKGPQK